MATNGHYLYFPSYSRPSEGHISNFGENKSFKRKPKINIFLKNVKSNIDSKLMRNLVILTIPPSGKFRHC